MQCKRCGVAIHRGLQVCPHCGARQKQQSSHIACSHCRRRSPSGLTICPHCGHRLRARRVPIGAAGILAIAMALSLAWIGGAFSNGWTAVRSFAEIRVDDLQTELSAIGGKVLDTASSLVEDNVPTAAPTPTPIVVLASLPDSPEDSVQPTPAMVAMETTMVSLVVAPTTVVTSEVTNEVEQVAATATPTAVPTDTPQPTEEPPTTTPIPPTPTPVPPTSTPTPVPPTATPTTPAPTPTPRPTEAVVAVAAGGASTATGGGDEYVVQPGDNWYSIASRFGLTQEALAAYNGQSPNEILQVNQRLRIPASNYEPPPPTATATRPPATPTAQPSPPRQAAPIASLPAPRLLEPANNDGFSGGANSNPRLVWSAVPGITARDHYYVRVSFPMANGETGYVEAETSDTEFTVPDWVYDSATAPDRWCRWTVQVRRWAEDGQLVELSPVSMSSSFYWR